MIGKLVCKLKEIINFDNNKNKTFDYFETNQRSQGEELYILMNSRGESLTDNESLHSELLKNLNPDDKNKWGIKWEEWQDFFWNNRGDNENADPGFNEFLKWVTDIERKTKNIKKNDNNIIPLNVYEEYFKSLFLLITIFKNNSIKIDKKYSETFIKIHDSQYKVINYMNLLVPDIGCDLKNYLDKQVAFYPVLIYLKQNYIDTVKFSEKIKKYEITDKILKKI